MPISTQQWQQSGQLRTLAGQRIFCIDSGDHDSAAASKPVVLLIHGYPTSSWDWEAVWPTLARHYRLVALDLLGFGFSAKPYPHPYQISEQADIVEALVAELGLTSFHVLAHDYGDTVAQELLYRQNTRTRPQWLSLCLLNGGLFPETHHARLIQKMMLTPMAPLLTAVMKEKQLHKTLVKIFGPHTPPQPEAVHAFWELINHNNGRRALNKLISYMPQRILHRERWVGALQHSCVPIGLINGAVDPISGAHMVARFLEVAGEPAFLLSLPTIGHYPQVEAPQAVADGYLAFINTVRERS